MLSGKPAPNTKLVWSPEQLHAFELAKSALKDAQSVVLPKPEDELQIITDGALQPTAVGAVLYVIRDGKPLLGGFFNAKLPPFQRRWLPCEIEGVSIGAALNHFAPYILQSDHKPTVITDSKACVDAVQKLRRGEFSCSARLCTFLSSVSRYQAEVKHIQGTNNIVSDYISRNPVPCETPSQPWNRPGDLVILSPAILFRPAILFTIIHMFTYFYTHLRFFTHIYRVLHTFRSNGHWTELF